MAEIVLTLHGEVVATALVDDGDLGLVGDRCWRLATVGYAVDSKRRLMHRELCGLRPGDKLTVDHLNGNKLDNRRENLRVVTQAENQQNRQYGYGSSKHRGVSWDKAKGKWKASVKLAGRIHNLGRYEREEDAALAASEFRAAHMPFSVDARAA